MVPIMWQFPTSTMVSFRGCLILRGRDYGCGFRPRPAQELLQAGDTELRSWFDGSYSTPEKDMSYGLLLGPCP